MPGNRIEIDFLKWSKIKRFLKVKILGTQNYNSDSDSENKLVTGLRQKLGRLFKIFILRLRAVRSPIRVHWPKITKKLKFWHWYFLPPSSPTLHFPHFFNNLRSLKSFARVLRLDFDLVSCSHRCAHSKSRSKHSKAAHRVLGTIQKCIWSTYWKSTFRHTNCPQRVYF